MRRANRAVCHLYDLVLAPTGMKATQFMILQVIADSGEIAQCDLARDFAISVESLSRRLAGARRSGLVQMKSGAGQRRMYSLTAAGLQELERVMPYWERAQRRLRRTLGEEGWNRLGGFADRVAQAAIEAETASFANRATQGASDQTSASSQRAGTAGSRVNGHGASERLGAE